MVQDCISPVSTHGCEGRVYVAWGRPKKSKSYRPGLRVASVFPKSISQHCGGLGASGLTTIPMLSSRQLLAARNRPRSPVLLRVGKKISVAWPHQERGLRDRAAAPDHYPIKKIDRSQVRFEPDCIWFTHRL